MRKRLLIITGVLGMALMTGCGSKQEDKKPVESVVEASTDSETSEVVNETKEVKESDEVAVIEEDTMDYSVFKAPETISEEGEDGERVVMYGMLGELDDSGFYEVYTCNGMFVFRINDDTIVEEGVELSSGTYVEVINTGVVTMSLPGQIANVLELKVVNAEDVVAEGRSIDELLNKTVDQEVSDEAELVEGSEVDKTYPEVEYDGNNATFYGEVKEITEEDDTVSYTVDTANGTKVFIVSKDLVSEDIKEGSNIKAVTDGIETRSIPGILSGVSSFELTE